MKEEGLSLRGRKEGMRSAEGRKGGVNLPSSAEKMLRLY